MNSIAPEDVAILRAVVAYLGERGQFAWWQSSFFSPVSHTFLTPVFARTPILAQCEGARLAAALVHDERIGVGRVYHLFRLPEDLEQAVHRALHARALSQRVGAICADKTAAYDYLGTMCSMKVASAVGPALIGDSRALRTAESWSVVAELYLRAFSDHHQVFPYFNDKG